MTHKGGAIPKKLKAFELTLKNLNDGTYDYVEIFSDGKHPVKIENTDFDADEWKIVKQKRLPAGDIKLD